MYLFWFSYMMQIMETVYFLLYHIFTLFSTVVYISNHSFFSNSCGIRKSALIKLSAREYRKLEQGFIHEQIQKHILRQTYAVL